MIFQWKDVDSQYDSCEVSFDLNGSQTKDGDKEVTLPFLQGEEFEVPGNEDISEMVIIPDCKEYGGIQYGNIVYSPGDIIIIPKIDSAVMWIVWNDNHDWGEWTITKEPAETSTGLKTRVCKNSADHIQTEIIPVINKEPKAEHPDRNKAPVTGVHDHMRLYVIMFLSASLTAFVLWFFLRKKDAENIIKTI